jgi:hypothetical protein
MQASATSPVTSATTWTRVSFEFSASVIGWPPIGCADRSGLPPAWRADSIAGPGCKQQWPMCAIFRFPLVSPFQNWNVPFRVLRNWPYLAMLNRAKHPKGCVPKRKERDVWRRCRKFPVRTRPHQRGLPTPKPNSEAWQLDSHGSTSVTLAECRLFKKRPVDSRSNFGSVLSMQRKNRSIDARRNSGTLKTV